MTPRELRNSYNRNPYAVEKREKSKIGRDSDSNHQNQSAIIKMPKIANLDSVSLSHISESDLSH